MVATSSSGDGGGGGEAGKDNNHKGDHDNNDNNPTMEEQRLEQSHQQESQEAIAITEGTISTSTTATTTARPNTVISTAINPIYTDDPLELVEGDDQASAESLANISSETTETTEMEMDEADNKGDDNLIEQERPSLSKNPRQESQEAVAIAGDTTTTTRPNTVISTAINPISTDDPMELIGGDDRKSAESLANISSETTEME
jgi:hypothetical protein